MTKVLQWLLISLTVIMLSACGGGSSTTNVEISGYAEDDPIAGAKVKLYDNGGNVISETKADENGHYQLDARVEKGKQYTLESQGVLAGQDVVLHSVFQYASNTEINTNPITELKYQLVRSGKSIDEAEALIRDYFIEINGETLEENRFDVQSSLAMGMSELAQLYGGQLPVDAVEKIKEDILNNDGVENKDFSYRNLVKNTITLEASAESVPVGEPVTVKVSGLSELNSHYEIKWSGVPEDANVSENSITFTVNTPQEVLVSTILYKIIDSNSTEVLSRVFIPVTFIEEGNIVDINTSSTSIGQIEVDFSSNTVENVGYTYQEITNLSPYTLASIKMGPTGSTFDEPVKFTYHYNPATVLYPENIVVKRSSGGVVDYLKPSRIDYNTSTLTFETEHFSTFDISWSNFNPFRRNTFEAWTDLYSGSFEDYSPYSYLQESVDKYCSELLNDEDKCEKVKEMVSNWDNAKEYEVEYRDFFNKDITYNYNNYDIFNNDFMVWNFAKRITLSTLDSRRTGYPGNLNNYREAVRFLLAKDSEGGRRNLNFFSGTELAYDVTEDFEDSKILNFVSKQLTQYTIKKALKSIGLQFDGAYVGAFIDAVNLFDITFKDMRSVGLAMGIAEENVDCLFAVAIKSINYSDAYECGYVYEIDEDGNFYENNQEIDDNRAKEIVTGIINDPSELEGEELEFLRTYYLLYKAITILKDSSNREEILNDTMKRGAIAAITIAKNAGVLDEDDINIPVDELSYDDDIYIYSDYEWGRTVSRNKESVSRVKSIQSIDKFLSLGVRVPVSKFERFSLKKVLLNGQAYDLSIKDNSFYKTFEISDVKEISKEVVTFTQDWVENNDRMVYLFSNLFTNMFDDQEKLYNLEVVVVYEYQGREYITSKKYHFAVYHPDEEIIRESKLISHVVDAVTKEPLEGVTIYIAPLYTTSLTDNEGNYVFSNLMKGNYRLDFMLNGYQTTSQYVTVEDNQTLNLEVSMILDDEHATTLGGADILVKDALNGSVITNGYIRVREGQNNKTGDVVQEIVNSDGNETIHIEMYPGIYTVEIGANGYTNAYNTVTILGDTNTSYEFSISPALAGDQVRIVLTWGESPSDLDSHLVRFTNEVQDYHVAYYDMAPADADANLDMDDTSSYGPETITINGVSNGSVYKYYVHDYSNGSDHNDTQLAASGAKVDVYYGDVSQTFYVPNETGNAWKVFEIVNGEIVPCTSECLFGVDGSSDEDIGLRSLTEDQTPDSVLFQDLPAK